MVCLIHGHACFHHYYSSALCMLCVVCCMLYVVCCAAAAGLLVEHEAMEMDCTVHYSGCHTTEGVPHLCLSYLIIMNPPIISDLETSISLSIATKHLSCLGKHRLDTYLHFYHSTAVSPSIACHITTFIVLHYTPTHNHNHIPCACLTSE